MTKIDKKISKTNISSRNCCHTRFTQLISRKKPTTQALNKNNKKEDLTYQLQKIFLLVKIYSTITTTTQKFIYLLDHLSPHKLTHRVHIYIYVLVIFNY